MNEHDEHTPENFELRPIEESELDLLADGELDEVRRRDLLARLEATPDGWRRCAMAFLEAQCWRESFGKTLAEAVPPAPVSTPLPPKSDPIDPARRLRRLGVVGAMAASFLVALGGVWYLRSGDVPPAMPPTVDVARHVPAPPEEKEPAPEPRQPGPADAPQDRAWQLVNVGSPGDPSGAAPGFQFPAVERERFDRDDVDRLSTGAPLHFVKSLEDAGHRLERSRSYVPVPLEDGRQMVIPVDDYDVKQGFPRFQ